MNLSHWIGTPYDLLNINGLNCWGLVANIRCELFDDELPDYQSKSLSRSDLCAAFTAAFLKDDHGFKKVDKPENYCVVIFKRNNKASHCGLWLDGKVLHSSSRTKQACYELFSVARLGFHEVEFWQK